MYGMWWKDDSDEYDEYDEYENYRAMKDFDDYEMKEEFDDYDNDIYDYNPTFLAVHEGDVKRFNSLLDKRHLEKNIRQRTMMHVAAARGHAKIVEILCQRKSLIPRRDGNGNTPLHLAIKYNHPEVFNLLLKKSNLNSKNFWDKRPLHFAADSNRCQFADALIKSGAEVDAEDMEGKTPLFHALVEKHVEVAEILLQNGANVHVEDMMGKTPLHLAIQMKNIQLVEIILKKGARVNALDVGGYMTPIQMAAEANDIHLVKMLLKYGAKPKIDQLDESYERDEEDLETTTALHFAAKVGNLEMVELLIENGFDKLDAINDENETPLCLAVTNHHLEVVKYLIEKGSKVEIEGDECLLDLCFTNEHIEVLKYLIDHGVKCPYDLDVNSLIFTSITSGDLELWKHLITCTSKIDAKSSSSETELHSAVRAGQVEIVKKIVNKQTSKIAVDSLASKLAVFIAVENGNEEILKILLEAGYSVESCFPNNLTPLHIAATFEHTRLVEMLLKAGANVNSKTISEIIPLDFAAAAGHVNMVKFLLDAGAVPEKVDKYLSTSLDYTLRRRNELSITSSMFQNLLKITEMLLIAGVCKTKEKHNYDILLVYAISLSFPSDDEQSPSCSNLKDGSNEDEENNKKREFRPEIIRCLINYLEDDKLNDSLNSFINERRESCTPEALDVILEYHDSKSQIKITYFSSDYWKNLHIIGQIEDVNNLLSTIQKHNSMQDNKKDDWTDLLKMVTARILLLLGDQQTTKEVFDFVRKHRLLIWQKDCQQQIKSMQSTKIIDDLNVTFYDILTKSVDKVATYIRDEQLLKNLESSYEKFPAYTQFLKISVQNGKQRNDLNDICVNGMFQMIEKNHKIQFSPGDVEEILKYLSVFDRRRLSAACSSLLSV